MKTTFQAATTNPVSARISTQRVLAPTMLALAIAATFGWDAANAACTANIPADGDTITCTGTDSAGVQGQTVSNVTVVVQSGATVQTTGYMVGAIQLDAHGSVSNYGTITSNGATAHGITTGFLTSNSNALGGATILNAGTIILYGPGSIGLNPNGGQVNLLNSGSITANGSTDSGIYFAGGDNVLPSSMTNTGTILVNGGGGGQFGIASSGNTVVTNSGSVTTTQDNSTGIVSGSVGSAPTVLNDTGGLVQTSGNHSLGVGVYDVGLPISASGNVPLQQSSINRGSITTTGDNSPGFDGMLGGNQGITLQNSGSITTAGSHSPGVNMHTDGSIGNMATVVNSGQITSIGDASDAVELSGQLSDGPFVVANSGTISASGNNALAIDARTLSSALTVTNASGGVITSAQSSAIASLASATITNQGMIHGDVDLSASAVNDVTLFTGSTLQGALNIGTNTASSLVLDGAGVAAYGQAVTGATTFAGTLTKQGSGNWIIDQDLAPSAIVITGGQLTVGNGATAGSVSSQVTIGNDAGIAFNRSDAVTFAGSINGNGTITAQGSGSTALTGGGTLSTSTAGVHVVNVEAGSLALEGFNLAATGTGASAIHLEGGSSISPEALSFTLGGLQSANAAVVSADGSVANVSITQANVTAASGQSVLDLRNGSSINAVFNHSTLVGDITADATSSAMVTLTNQSTLTGAIDPVGVAISGNSAWNINGNSTISSLDVANGAVVRFQDVAGYRTLVDHGALTGSGATFFMNTNLAALQGDQIAIQGATAGVHQVAFTNTGGAPSAPFQGLEVIATPDGTAQFQSPVVNAGLYGYNLVKGTGAANAPIATNWYLLNQINPNAPMAATTPSGASGTPTLSPTGAAVMDTAAGASLAWFNQLDTLSKRMGDLQDDSERDVHSDDVWGRYNGSHLSANSVDGATVSDHYQGVDFGIDHTMAQGDHSRVVAGGFVGAGRNDESLNEGNGRTTTGYAGLYATLLMPEGWYTDFVVKAQRLRNSFDTNDGAGQLGSGRYSVWGFGGSAEVGKKIGLDGAWYVTPQAQVAFTHFTDASYATSNGVAIAVGDANVAQSRIGFQLGEALKSDASTLDPYAKLNVVNQSTSGGNVMAAGSTFKAQLDGTRVDMGAGLVYKAGSQTELHFDAERSVTSTTVRKDWEINAGLRYSF